LFRGQSHQSKSYLYKTDGYYFWRENCFLFSNPDILVLSPEQKAERNVTIVKGGMMGYADNDSAIRSQWQSLLCAGLFSCLVVPDAFAIPVTVDSSLIGVSVYDDNGGLHQPPVFNGTAIPTSASLLAQKGLSSSSTEINWSGDAANAIFSFDMIHSIDNTAGAAFAGGNDNAHTFSNDLIFTADVAATYDISGYYSVTNPVDTRILLDVSLKDITTVSTSLFTNISESFSTSNESFTVGASGEGDKFGFLTGSSTGNLIAGHQYELSFGYLLQSRDDSSAETFVKADAEGNLTLAINDPSFIVSAPEPTSLSLIALGLAGLGFKRRFV